MPLILRRALLQERRHAFAVIRDAMKDKDRVALARIVLDAHYTSDAIGGAIVGTLGAVLVVRAFARRRLTLKITADGKIRPMPGPSMRRIAALAVSIGGAVMRARASKSAADGRI